jgi:hypothetical protein
MMGEFVVPTITSVFTTTRRRLCLNLFSKSGHQAAHKSFAGSTRKDLHIDGIYRLGTATPWNTDKKGRSRHVPEGEEFMEKQRHTPNRG